MANSALSTDVIKRVERHFEAGKRIKAQASTGAKLRRLEPEDWQEKQEPSGAAIVVLDKRKEKVRRRKADDRVWGAMTAAQELSAERIIHGHLLTGGSVGVPVARYGVRLDKGEVTDDASRRAYEGWVARVFQEWVRECRRNGLHAVDALDYLTKGAVMREIDARREQRKGTAVGQFFEMLDLHVTISSRMKRKAA